MNAVTRLRAEFVEFIPERLAPGVIYISERYATASHLCCCGCGLETVTPLNPAKWSVIERGGAISLTPSVGNWSFPCRSHYIIDRGQVVWAKSFSPNLIASVRASDQRDAEILARHRSDIPQSFGGRVSAFWRNFLNVLGF